MKRRLIVPVNPELLGELLGLPKDMKIVDVRWDFERNSILAKLECERFDEVGEAQPIPYGEFFLKDNVIVLETPSGVFVLRPRL